MDMAQVQREFAKLRQEHMHDRDRANNYGCFNVEHCTSCNYVYNSRNAMSCHNCDSVIDCVQCIDCRDCAFCIGLNGSQYHILNQEYSKEDYYMVLETLGVDWNVETFDPMDTAD